MTGQRKTVSVATVVLAMVVAVANPALATEPDIAPLMMGQPAPWSGLLVPEARFAKMLRLQVDVDELGYKLQLREKLYSDATAMLQKQLGDAQMNLNRRVLPEPWYRTHVFLFCFGVTVGMSAAIGAVYGASKLR